MIRFLTLLFALAAFHAAAAHFVMPAGCVVLNQDDSGKTWAMNAYLDLPMQEAKKKLSEAIIQTGFKLKHEIPMDEKGERHILISYKREKEELILMLWSENGKRTYFSYGVHKG